MPVIEGLSECRELLGEQIHDTLICDDITKCPWNLATTSIPDRLTRVSTAYFVIIEGRAGVKWFEDKLRRATEPIIHQK